MMVKKIPESDWYYQRKRMHYVQSFLRIGNQDSGPGGTSTSPSGGVGGIGGGGGIGGIMPMSETPTAAELGPQDMDPIAELDRDLARFENQLAVFALNRPEARGMSDPTSPDSGAKAIEAKYGGLNPDWMKYLDDNERRWVEDRLEKLKDKMRRAMEEDFEAAKDVLGTYGIDVAQLPPNLFAAAGDGGNSVTVGGVSGGAESGGPGGGVGGWG